MSRDVQALTQDESLQVDDETLLGLIKSQDEGALSSLYDRYSRMLFSIALRITGDSGTAEEVMQDVFHAVWACAGQFRPSAGSVQAWLGAITRNRAIDEVRSRWHRARLAELPFDGLPDLQAAMERGWEHVAALRADLRAALAALPLPQRQVIELAYYGGLTSSEIASRLGESVGTIKSRLRLGLEKLREGARPWWDGAEPSV